ncbi:MAG: acyltransferase [Candidatus Aminicenantes bacterium]|nr:acyltransferase [Candidatus Aminicenantes bacterium]
MGRKCSFLGHPLFHRQPGSRIAIGANCVFNSSPGSNLIGVNHPCMISTLQEAAEISIGDGCGFSGTMIACAQKVTLGKNVRCGSNTMIMDTDWHWNDPRVEANAPVAIGDNVWLSVNVTVLKGVTIGEGTLVGAGSMVTKSLPAHVIAAGVPARVLRTLDGDGRSKENKL